MQCTYMVTKTSKARSAEARTDKHREMHKLVQTWIAPEAFEKLSALAKKQTRTMAAFFRHELYKLIGFAE
jgi:hypothetical protein